MTIAWIIFNFVLIILILYLILHLYQRIRVLEQIKTDRILDDINEAFTAYLEDVRKENERLASKVEILMKKNAVSPEETEMQGENTAGPLQPEEEKRSETPAFGQLLKEKIAEIPDDGNPAQVADGEASADKTGEPASWVPPVDQIRDSLEESPFFQAMKLQKKGYTVNEIAKKMNRGAGEIELLLKFGNKVSR
ncbi:MULTISPECIES: hypothetical protein [unclassified Sporolactobacillus]|uniref:hypothetical protein n=1 Tax=unclassified Sporolactobacillus TaxID=2628533 RepID=UPI0023676EF4|nr:hypothetical protein [Sporolactobacillus sp. CQH2019]MDD9147039.1 hypothetical protein [Sporolactobacillus sp. CQH2019]